MAVLMLAAASLSTSTVAAAAGHIASLLDYSNVLTDSEEDDLRKLLAFTALKIEANVGVIITDDIYGASPREYTESELERLFGANSDSLVLLICNDFETGYDYISCTGTAADRYHDESHEMLSSFYYGLDHSGYYHGIVDFCEYLGVTEVDAGIISPSDAPVAVSYTAVLADYDDCFTDSEENDLISYMQMTANEIECHVGIVTSSDLRGMNDKQYAVQFYQDSFGSGSNAVVLLFCNDHVNYDYIYTYGLGTDKFDSRIDDIFDDIYDALGDDADSYDYYQASMSFCSYMRNHNYETDYNDYYDDDDFHFSGEGSFTFDFGIAVFVGAILSLIVTTISVKSTTNAYKKKAPISARHYLDQTAIKWLDRQDIYLRETNTSVRISSSSSGGGRSRSGGGGRRRSGGGGGRGRRR